MADYRAYPMQTERGFCLVSQQIRELIEKGIIKTDFSTLSRGDNGIFTDESLEKRVQPSSFEPVLGQEAFILDTEEQGAFSPASSETVYRALLRLPKRQRDKVNISGGFELKTGFTYLFPLQERLLVEDGMLIESSPKSSTGRNFPRVRMVADFNPAFDEINHLYGTGITVHPWLLVQPTAFNLIVDEGLPLTQLRFLFGNDVSLSQSELIEEYSKTPMLHFREKDSSLAPLQVPVITSDGLQMDIDLEGRDTSGIVGLRARKNPNPIDLRKNSHHIAEDYFEPVERKDGKVKFRMGEHYLLASRGVLSVPVHLSAKLRRHYGRGARGDYDEAGFVDNGFTGD